MHILIADDDPGTRLVVAAAVERLGHESPSPTTARRPGSASRRSRPTS
jgi:CheY-like chemotaxis protein